MFCLHGIVVAIVVIVVIIMLIYNVYYIKIIINFVYKNPSPLHHLKAVKGGGYSGTVMFSHRNEQQHFGYQNTRGEHLCVSFGVCVCVCV